MVLWAPMSNGPMSKGSVGSDRVRTPLNGSDRTGLTGQIG